MSDGFFVAACAVVALLDAQCGQLFACPKELVINWKNCSIGKIPTYIINLVCIGNWHVNAVTPPLWWNMSCWLSSSPSSKFTSLTKKKIKIKKKKYTPPEENFSTVQKKSKYISILFKCLQSWILSKLVSIVVVAILLYQLPLLWCCFKKITSWLLTRKNIKKTRQINTRTKQNKYWSINPNMVKKISTIVKKNYTFTEPQDKKCVLVWCCRKATRKTTSNIFKSPWK